MARKRKHGRPTQYSVASMVLAYELHTTGASWHLLRRHFGLGIRDAINRAKRNGITHLQ